MVPLMNCFNSILDNTTPEKLDFDTSEALELPLVWLLSTSVSLAWEARPAGKRLQLLTFGSEVEARIVFLKKTKWKHYTLHNSALILEEMINLPQ